MEEKQRGLRFGSVEFSGYGAFPERFATELISRGVELRRVRFGDGTISGSVSPADYWETARTARRCGLRIRAGKRRGLYFTALRYSRRAGLYVGFLAFVMLTALSGSRIQDIEIVSSGTVTAAQRSHIMSILGECGLTEGSSARRLENSTTAAERRILLEIPEAAWVDVTCVGFRLEAAVEMGTPAPEMLDSDAPCNLVASRAAAVVSHVVRDGVLVADTGSGVPEGGLLVSGTVADAAGNVILKHASAEIIGEYTETREFFVPYKETLRLPEGETAEYRWLVYGDDEYPLFFGGAAMLVFFAAMKLARTEQKMRNSAKEHRLIKPFALNVYVSGTYVGPEMQDCNLYLLGFCFKDEDDCENEATTDEFRLYEEEEKDLFCEAFQRGELIVAVGQDGKAVVLETGMHGEAEDGV